MQVAAYVTAILLACMAVTAFWCVAALRLRLGWNSGMGKTVWLVLGLSGFGGPTFIQLWVYRKIVGTSPFDDFVIMGTISIQSAIVLSIAFYYVWKYDPQ
jgi:hypothetical protein